MLWFVVAAILAVTLQAVIHPVSGATSTCSAYLYPRAEAVDVKVAGILGMHDSDGGKCGTTYNAAALQNAIALHFAADLINGYNGTASFIPGVRIGVDIYDDCNTKILAATHAGGLASQTTCMTDCSANPAPSQQDVPVVGVIGTSISDTTTTVASMLGSSFIPVLGPSATIPELSNKTKYPHFVRLVPSDFKQIQVIVQLAKRFHWSYIIGLATSDNYGRDGMTELRRQAMEQMICVSVIEDFDQFDESQMMTFARSTLAKKIVNTKDNIGIVYFGLNDPLIRFLKFIDRVRNSWSPEDSQRLQRIYWLASDAVQVSQDLAATISLFNTNILVVSPFPVNITYFKQYFIEFLKAPPAWVSGQWKLAISHVVQNTLGCQTYNFTEESLTACNIDKNLVFDAYIPSVLDAFFILANTIKALHEDACKNVSGPCAAFKAKLSSGLLKSYSLLNLDYSTIKSDYLPPEFSLRKLQNISGDFEVVNQPQYSLKAIKRGSFVKVAEFEDDIIVATPELDSIFGGSECKAVCKDCQDVGEISYLYHPGDVLFIGIVSIHWPSDENPYKCDMYRETTNSYIAMEAFINTVYQLNNITGIDFGYLILDDCYSALTLTKLLNGVLSGDITIESSSSRKFNTSQVAVAIGAESSDVTLAALPILRGLSIPMISYSATHPILDNRIIYPYFSRTVSSDIVQSKAFVSILKSLEVTFVGAIVVENSYGLGLYTLFRHLAESERICVDDAIRITNPNSGIDLDSVLENYRREKIQVIIIIAMGTTIKNLLDTVKLDDTFVFLASETWGPNSDILRGDGGKKARGCLVLGAEPAKFSYNIKKHLETLDPYANTSTVWLRDFWQDQFQCDIPGGFSNTHGGKICSKSVDNLSTVADVLADSPIAVHAAMATMSAGLTISDLFKRKKQMPFNATEFTQTLRSVKLASSSGQIRPFNDDGNGDFGFQIFNVQSSTDSKERYVYVNVGSYDDKMGLSLNKSLIKFYDVSGHVTDKVESSCSFRQQCSTVCVGSTTNPGPILSNITGHAGSGETTYSNTAVIVLSVLLAFFVLLAILVTVLGLLAFTGKIRIKGRSLIIGYDDKISGKSSDNMESSETLNRVQNNTYSTPNDSSGTNDRPQLPARKKPNHKVVYTNKSFSDIVPSNHGNTVGHITRDRSQSVPTQSHHAISSNQLLQLHVSHKPRDMMISHFNGSQLFHEIQNPRENNPYSPVYANTTKSVNYPQSFPQEEIIFQNVPSDSAVYKLNSPVDVRQNGVLDMFHPHTEYIPVQTPQGIAYILSEDFQRMLQASSSFVENQSNHAQAESEIHDHNTSQATANLVASGGSLQNYSHRPIFMSSRDYITPLDVIYDTQHTPLNSAGAKLSPENGTWCVTDHPVNAVVNHPENSNETSKVIPVPQVWDTYTVDSSSSMLSHPIAQANATMVTVGSPLAQANASKMSPVSLSQPPSSVFKTAARPDSLQVVPIYAQIRRQISQDVSDTPDGVQARHISQDNLSPNNHQNKDANNKTPLDDSDTYVAQLDQQMKAHHHYRPPHIRLSHVTEELEEIV